MDTEHQTLTDEIRSQAPGSFVSLSKGTVHYELSGPKNGETIVLVHGISVPYFVWDPTFEALKSAGFRIFRYDLYGRGSSDRPNIDYTLDLFVTQLDELLTALNISAPVHLVGLSMGGPIVAAFSKQHPERVGRIALLDPVVEPLGFTEILPLRIPFIGEYLMCVYGIPVLLPKRQMGSFYQPERFPNWLTRFQEQTKYTGYRNAIHSTLLNLMSDIEPIDLYRNIAKSHRDVLLVRGKEDHTITRNHILKVQKAIPYAQYHEIEKAGHISHFERPDVVSPLLVSFFAH